MIYSLPGFPYFLEEIVTTSIGGAIGGFISYTIVIYRENNREKRLEEKEKLREQKEDYREKRFIKMACTKSLFFTQMSIKNQMDKMQGLKKICSDVINFHLSSRTLLEHLANLLGTSARTDALVLLIKDNQQIKELLEFNKFIIISPAFNHVISSPNELYELIDLTLVKGQITIKDVALYLDELVKCDTNYQEIISLIDRQNQVRDMVLIQPISKDERGLLTPLVGEELYKHLRMVVIIFETAIMVYGKINEFLVRAGKAFDQAGDYIELIGMHKPIRILRDQGCIPAFERKDIQENTVANSG